jgi:hypothetical protein
MLQEFSGILSSEVSFGQEGVGGLRAFRRQERVPQESWFRRFDLGRKELFRTRPPMGRIAQQKNRNNGQE